MSIENADTTIQAQLSESFYDQISAVLDDMTWHMDRLEAEPGCQDSAHMLLRGWKTLEKGGAMFGHGLVAQMAKDISQMLDFHLGAAQIVDREAIALSRKIHLRVSNLLG